MEQARRRLRICLICVVCMAIAAGAVYYYFQIENTDKVNEGTFVQMQLEGMNV